MSIEFFQFPRHATKQDLIREMKKRGFSTGDNPFHPGPSGTVHFFWSEPRNFLSSSGIDASIYPLSDEGKAAWHTANNWWLRTRTSIGASTYDQRFQNETARAIRKAFGGIFYNDHAGHNRYTTIESVTSTPSSRGIYAALSRVTRELDSLEHVIPPEQFKVLNTPSGPITEATDKISILRIVQQADPSRVIYNALVPFLVAALEHVFRETFEILVKYDLDAQAVLENQNRKLSFADARALTAGTVTLERIASSWYSFQNLDSIQKAFKDVLNIDIWKLIRTRRKVRDKLPMLSDALNKMIGARHGVVHSFLLDRELNREGFLQLLQLVRTIIAVLEAEVSRKLEVRINPG
jgi:hypothetical protein